MLDVANIETSLGSKKLALSVNEFCAAVCIGRSKFYDLVKERKGPPVIKVGRRSLILLEDATAWLKGLRSTGERP